MAPRTTNGRLGATVAAALLAVMVIVYWTWHSGGGPNSGIVASNANADAPNAAPPVSEIVDLSDSQLASVKVAPVLSGDLYNINLGTVKNDTVTFSNASLADCIRFAYGLTSDAQLAGPDWSTRWEYVAQARQR